MQQNIELMNCCHNCAAVGYCMAEAERRRTDCRHFTLDPCKAPKKRGRRRR